MPIKWKKKFKPEYILQRIARCRTVTAEKAVSFSGFELHECMPVLSSMLDFPEVAERVNKSALIWSALARPDNDLSKDAFLAAINGALSKELATELKHYTLLTSISIAGKELPRRIRLLDTQIELMAVGFLERCKERVDLLQKCRVDIRRTPDNYLPVRVSVREKSPGAAAQKAIDQVDLLRGMMCLQVNFVMQSSFGGGQIHRPINRVRCGGFHTVHLPNGAALDHTVWYEPNFRPANIYQIKEGKKFFAAMRKNFERLFKSPCRGDLIRAVITYARALDEPDHNAAFIKLWSALESLVTPGVADYDKLVRRCSFMFDEMDYNLQVLEHLREYRNRSVHSGVEGSDGMTNCYLLQEYFRAAVRFYVGNYRAFSTLNEANDFLDLPSDIEALVARAKLIRKAIRYVSPTTS